MFLAHRQTCLEQQVASHPFMITATHLNRDSVIVRRTYISLGLRPTGMIGVEHMDFVVPAPVDVVHLVVHQSRKGER